jgi:hypothetical protein
LASESDQHGGEQKRAFAQLKLRESKTARARAIKKLPSPSAASATSGEKTLSLVVQLGGAESFAADEAGGRRVEQAVREYHYLRTPPDHQRGQ